MQHRWPLQPLKPDACSPLLNDGATLNVESDEFVQNIVTLGGSAMGKSAMMPPYGRVLSAEEIRSVIAFARAVRNRLSASRTNRVAIPCQIVR
jgi:hypothetical protein